MSANISKRLARSPRVRRNPTYERILVAVEDEPSMGAVRVAAEIAARIEAEVLAVHVQVAEVPCCGPSAEACGLGDLGGALDQATMYLRRAAVRHRGELWRAQGHQVVASLLKAADEYGADLLVVSSRRGSGLQGLFHRDLGLSLARRSSRPVLLVPRD